MPPHPLPLPPLPRADTLTPSLSHTRVYARAYKAGIAWVPPSILVWYAAKQLPVIASVVSTQYRTTPASIAP